MALSWKGSEVILRRFESCHFHMVTKSAEEVMTSRLAIVESLLEAIENDADEDVEESEILYIKEIISYYHDALGHVSR